MWPPLSHSAPSRNHRIVLNFTFMDTECTYDYLFVYDGDSYQSPLLASLSGKTLPQPIEAKSGKVSPQISNISMCFTCSNFLYFPFMSVCVDFIRMIRIITKYVNARLLGYWSLSDSFLTFTVFPHIHDIFLIFLLFLFARCCSTSSVTQTTTCWASMPPTHFQFVLETAVVMGGVM